MFSSKYLESLPYKGANAANFLRCISLWSQLLCKWWEWLEHSSCFSNKSHLSKSLSFVCRKGRFPYCQLWEKNVSAKRIKFGRTLYSWESSWILCKKLHTRRTYILKLLLIFLLIIFLFLLLVIFFYTLWMKEKKKASRQFLHLLYHKACLYYILVRLYLFC